MEDGIRISRPLQGISGGGSQSDWYIAEPGMTPYPRSIGLSVPALFDPSFPCPKYPLIIALNLMFRYPWQGTQLVLSDALPCAISEGRDCASGVRPVVQNWPG